MSHIRHSCRLGLVLEERARVQPEREQFGSDDAIHVQLLKGRPISFKHYIGKGAVCVYDEDAQGRSSICRYLSEERPVPLVRFQIMHQEQFLNLSHFRESGRGAVSNEAGKLHGTTPNAEERISNCNRYANRCRC